MTATMELDTPALEGRDEKLHAALEQVRELANASVDAVIPQAGLAMIPASAEARANGADPVYLTARTAEGTVPLRVLGGAHEQLAEKLMPRAWPYYQRMLAEAPELLATNLNTWLARQPQDKRLLRMVRPLPGDNRAPFEAYNAPFAVRAYLSDGYKVIDHFSVLKVLAPEMAERAAEVAEFHLSETKMNIRVVTPVQDLSDILGPGHRAVNEMVAIGIALRNSETGHAAVTTEIFARILRCSNGLVVDEPLRIAHLGKRQESDAAWMSEQTRRVTDAADLLRIRDRIRTGFGDESRRKVAGAIAAAAGEPLPEISGMSAFLTFIGNVGARFELSAAERDALLDTGADELAQAEVRPSEATRWNAAQAFTALARDTKAAGNFDRGTEIEKFGWKILTDPMDALVRAGKAASN